MYSRIPPLVYIISLRSPPTKKKKKKYSAVLVPGSAPWRPPSSDDRFKDRLMLFRSVAALCAGNSGRSCRGRQLCFATGRTVGSARLYSLKRAQLKVFEDFLRCVALVAADAGAVLGAAAARQEPGPQPRPRSPATRSASSGRNFVAMLDALESRDLCARMRSTNDRRSHILVPTDKGSAVLRARQEAGRQQNARARGRDRGAWPRHSHAAAGHCWRCWRPGSGPGVLRR